METLGLLHGWYFFQQADAVVAVDARTFDVTEPLDAATVLSSAHTDQWKPWTGDSRCETARRIASDMFAERAVPNGSLPITASMLSPDRAIAVPPEVAEASRRGLQWARSYPSRAESATGALRAAAVLVKGDTAPLRTVRMAARAWPLLADASGAEGWDRGSPGFPSGARIAWELLGGDAGREWSEHEVQQAARIALLAAAYAPPGSDEDIDGDTPEDGDDETPSPDTIHRFTPADGATFCTYCLKGEYIGNHHYAAISPEILITDPEHAHYFTEEPFDPDRCEICGNAYGHDLHKQAALAQYYEFREQTDRLIDADREFRQARETMVASGIIDRFGAYAPWADGTEVLDPHEAAARAEEDAEVLFWVREHHEDEDPLAYYVSTADGSPDSTVVDALYVFDNSRFYLLDPVHRVWQPAALPQGGHVYPVDDEAARFALVAFLRSPAAVDLLDCDPGEAELMRSCGHAAAPWSDNGVLISDAGASPADVQIPDSGGYTQEERSANASKQVRDASGRFSGGGGGDGGAPSRSGSKGPAKARLGSPRATMPAGSIKALFDGFAAYVQQQRASVTAAAGAEGAPISDPAASDVKPIHLAIMDDLDPEAVMDLVSLVPATTASVTPRLLKRIEGGAWEDDLALLRRLQGPTPPPVVALDDAEYQDVLAQVDAFYVEEKAEQGQEEPPPVAAALYGPYGEIVPGGISAAGVPGIADTPSDAAAAARLRAYWTIGKGGTVKVRWNTPGDMTRCMRHLRKYLGPRAAGYCLSGDTEFITRDGTMTLEEAAGTRQFVLTGSREGGTTSENGRWVEAEISSFGEQPLLHVTLSRGGIEKTLRATPQHRWFASPNGRNMRRFDMDVVTTEDLRPGMVLASLRHSPVGWDEVPDKLAFMAGFVYGDGSQSSVNRTRVDLWGAKMQLRDMFAAVASSVSAEKELTSGVLGVRVHGLPGDWKVAPSLQRDDSYLFGWLAGYLAADGSVSANGSLVLSSKHKSDISLVQDICNRLGIATAVTKAYSRTGYNDYLTDLHRITLRAKTFGPNLLVRTDHREAAQRFFVEDGRGPLIRWQVLSVEDRGEVEEVFCATVPETESFALADNIWSLNCAKLHHQMTGVWPGDRRNIGKRNKRRGRALSVIDTPYEIASSDAVVASAFERAVGSGPCTVTAAGDAAHGAPFIIPVLLPIEAASGDERTVRRGALSTRDLPIPLLWQMKTKEGHDESVIVGRIDSVEELANGSLGNARGVFDTGPYAREAERMVRHRFLRGVSADLDKFEAIQRNGKGEDDLDENAVRISADPVDIVRARVMAATLVAKPSFQECAIELDETEQPEAALIADGTYIATPGTQEELMDMMEAALTAAGIPLSPPREWFEDPKLAEPTPMVYDPEGRVFGHIATWDTDHIGLPFSTRPPKSRSGYGYFHTGVIRTADGADIPVGQLTLTGGHAPLDASAQLAARHYDDTASAFADVRIGEDAHGIWAAGALRTSVSGEQLRAIRASAPSGDWRPINGRLELVAVCQVNAPGFPIARAMVASGEICALVAAGTAVLNAMRIEDMGGDGGQELLFAADDVIVSEDPMQEARTSAVDRVLAVKRELLSAKQAAASTRMQSLVAGLPDQSLFRQYSDDQRARMAGEGTAMDDGSYPIATVADLKNAIRAYGRASNKAAVRRHIRKRARALGRTELLPESWGTASMLRGEFAVLSAGTDGAELFKDYSPETREEYAGKGWAMEGGRYPIATVADLKRAIHAYGRGDPDDKPAIRRHIRKRARALGRTELLPESWSFSAIVDEDLSADTEDAIALLAAGGYYPNGEPWDPKNHPRDPRGRFRKAIARLKRTAAEAKEEDILEAVEKAEEAERENRLDDARIAVENVLEHVDAAGNEIGDPDTVDDLREGYRDLGRAVANMPMELGSLNNKFRYTDLPADLRGLIEDLFSRVESRLDDEHAEKAGGAIKEFMAGGDLLSQPEISAELARMLRYLI